MTFCYELPQDPLVTSSDFRVLCFFVPVQTGIDGVRIRTSDKFANLINQRMVDASHITSRSQIVDRRQKQHATTDFRLIKVLAGLVVFRWVPVVVLRSESESNYFG